MNGFFTVTETMAYLKLHRNTILRYIRQGKLPAVKFGRVWRIPRESLDKLVADASNKGGTTNA